MILNASTDFFSIKLELLSESEIEFWIYKAEKVYKSKIKEDHKMQALLGGVSYLLNRDNLNDDLFNILITLEDNLKYDLKMITLKKT